MSKSQHHNPTFSSKVQNWLSETSCTPDVTELGEWENHHLFVYGSCRLGFRLQERLAEATLCGYGMTANPKYLMAIFRGRYPYPVALETEDTTLAARIWGEVYSVTPEQMIHMDFMESNTATWKRKRIPIEMIGPKRTQKVMAYMYVGNMGVWEKKFHTPDLVFKAPRLDEHGLPKHYQFLIRDQTDKAFIAQEKRVG
jgi:gamma-glutamylcyclotransferase (GGCT)/AIG2-like uncharacterized protein YtfP